MKSNNAILFIIPAVIWGSTWYVIKFQLGVVPPIWSVSYRFILAGLVLMAYSRFAGLNLKFTRTEHLRMVLQGALLFGLNYWLTYVAEEVLTSALMSVSFSMIMFFNIIFGWVFLGKPSPGKVWFGALLGVTGTFLIYFEELKNTPIENLPVFSISVGFLSVAIASLGNITSAANQNRKLPVIQSNAFGMIYGGLLMAVIAFCSGQLPVFEFTSVYIGSLLYLSFFGSIAAFSSYLTLIGRIGPSRAAYVLITIPVLSIVISTLFEGFQFAWYALAGIVLILGGNLLIIKK